MEALPTFLRSQTPFSEAPKARPEDSHPQHPLPGHALGREPWSIGPRPSSYPTCTPLLPESSKQDLSPSASADLIVLEC